GKERIPMQLKTCLSLFLLCGSAALDASGKPESAKHTPAVIRSAPEPVPEAPLGAKVIVYGEQDVVRIRTKLRYTTLIVLPKNEQILDFTCGDKDLWVVNGAQNFAYVKHAKAGSETNLNLVTASGNVYSFALIE